jgi:enoyl-CoA hydratase
LSSDKHEDVRLDRREGLLVVTLNRPDAYNAITPAMVAGFDAAMDQVDSDPTIRALAITGAGPAFCAGADLKGVGAKSEDPTLALKRLLERSAETFSRLEMLRVPTIAALNGITLAGGLEIMLCCDIVVAADNAKVGDGHARYAQLPGGGGTVRLPRRIGASRAKYLMFSGDVIGANQAMEWGLADFVVPAGELMQFVDDMARKFASKSSLVLERMKWLVQQAQEQPLEAGLRAEISMCAWHVSSHDRNEGLSAFAAKRTPQYLGR